jgi:hypothetical protein
MPTQSVFPQTVGSERTRLEHKLEASPLEPTSSCFAASYSGDSNSNPGKQARIFNATVTSGFRRNIDEDCALLGCYPASSGNTLPTFRENVDKGLPLDAAQYRRTAQFSSSRHFAVPLSPSNNKNPGTLSVHLKKSLRLFPNPSQFITRNYPLDAISLQHVYR